MSDERAFSDEMSTAYLPGVGFVLNPQPEHYRKAIRFLERKERGREPIGVARRSLRWRLMATARRLEWTPERLRKMREQGP